MQMKLLSDIEKSLRIDLNESPSSNSQVEELKKTLKKENMIYIHLKQVKIFPVYTSFVKWCF